MLYFNLFLFAENKSVNYLWRMPWLTSFVKLFPFNILWFPKCVKHSYDLRFLVVTHLRVVRSTIIWFAIVDVFWLTIDDYMIYDCWCFVEYTATSIATHADTRAFVCFCFFCVSKRHPSASRYTSQNTSRIVPS